MAETSLNPQVGAGHPARLRFGEFRLDLGRAELTRADAPIALRPKAFDLLALFARRPGQVLSKEEILAAVWPGVVVTEDSLTQCVHELRGALGDAGAALLKTIPRRGYRFDAVVQADMPKPPGHRNSLHWWATGAVVAVVAAVAVGLLRPVAPPKAPGPLSIVVLPLAAEGAGTDGGWFADALLADLTAELAQVSGTLVISRDTALRYKGRVADTRAIASELGVRYIVQGTVRRQGDRVRMSLWLVNGESGVQEWARQFDMERARLAPALDDVVKELARGLSVQMYRSSGERAAGMDPAQVRADDLAMQGWSVYFRGVTRENLREAGGLFEAAVAQDPRSIRGWGGIAIMNGLEAGNLWAADQAAAITRLEEASTKLQTLDSGDVYAHFARYFIAMLKSDYEALLLISTEMTRRFPSHPQPHFGRAMALMNLGRFDECVEPTQRALRLGPRDPAVPLWNRQIGMCHFMRGEYREAAQYARVSQQADMSRASATLLLAASLARLGEREEAARIVADFRSRNPGYSVANLEAVLRENRNERYLEGRGRWVATLRELGVP